MFMDIQGLEETFSDTCLHCWRSLHCLGSHSKIFKAERPRKSSISKGIYRHCLSKKKIKFFVELYSYALKKGFISAQHKFPAGKFRENIFHERCIFQS